MTERRPVHFWTTLGAVLLAICLGAMAAPVDETVVSDQVQADWVRVRAAELADEIVGDNQIAEIAARIQAENPDLTISDEEVLERVGEGITVGEVLNASEWLASQSASIAVAILAAVLLWGAVRIITRRHWRAARRIRSEIDEQPEARIAEADGALRGGERLEEFERERDETMRRMADLERRAQRAEQTALSIQRVTATVITLGVIAWAVWLVIANDGIRQLSSLMTPAVVGTVVRKAVKIAVIILMVNLLRGLIRLISRRVLHRVSDDDPEKMTEVEMRAQTLVNVLNGTASVVLWVLAGIMILDEFGIPIGPLLAGAGILGLAIGFGSQSLVRDFISGFFILMENQYRVGDVINVAGTGGLVERVTMRTTWLRDLHGSVHVIPNGEITAVTNMTFQWSRHVAEIGVSYNDDPDQVIELLERVGREMRAEAEWSDKMMEDPEVLGLDSFGDSAVVFKVILKTKPLQQWATGREFKRRVFYAFAEAGIEIPYPHQTTYLRMEDEATLNLLTGQPEDEEKAPAGLRPHVRRRHVPPVVPEESGQGGDGD